MERGINGKRGGIFSYLTAREKKEKDNSIKFFGKERVI